MLGIELLGLFCLGLIWGSFANVLVDRSRQNKSLSGRSECDQCGVQLSWFDNIPVFSFIFLRGRCRKCKKKIKWQYPLVEFSMGLLFALIGWVFLSGEMKSVFSWGHLVFHLALGFLFLSIAVWDIKYLLIPDSLVIVGLLLTVIWKILLAAQRGVFLEGAELLGKSLLGGLIGGSFFYLLWFFSKGKWTGGGDVKLGAWLGFLVGWQMIYSFFLVAYLGGSLVAIGLLILKKRKLSSQIPFGPFLLFSALLIVLWQQEIVDFYNKLVLRWL